MVTNFDRFFLKDKILKLVDSIITSTFSDEIDLNNIDNFTKSIIDEETDILLVYMAIQLAAHKICSTEYYLTAEEAADEIVKNEKYLANKEWYDSNLKVHKSQAKISLMLIEAYFYKWRKLR